VPNRRTPEEQTFPARAAAKRKAAERCEARAHRLRAEAAELERRWDTYEAGRRRGLAERLAS
jgi:hypothetical protein